MMPFRPLRPLRGFRVTEPAIQCSTRMDRNPANPEHYFSYLKRKFDARGFDIRLCGRSASIEMNGSPLCTQHAGELLLSMLAAGELVFTDGSDPFPSLPPVEYADIGEIRIRRRAASADTHPEGGDVEQAPFMGSAVAESETPNHPSQSEGESPVNGNSDVK